MTSAKADITRAYSIGGLAAAIFIVVALNIPHAGHYFSQDDFAGMKFHAESARDFAGFFIPEGKSTYFGYRPLSFQVKFWLMREAFGFNPVPHHLLPLLFHCLNILLCYRFLLMLTCRRDAALLAAVLYGLCGAHQMSLYWISAGNEPMTAFFFLLGLNAFLAWRRKPGLIRAASVVILFILMLLCKENTLVFPVILLLIDIIFPENVAGRRISIGRRIAFYTPLFAVATAHVTFWLLTLSRHMKGKSSYILILNPLTMAVNLVVYLGLVFIGNAIIYGIMLAIGKDDPRGFVTAVMLSPAGSIIGLIFVAIAVLMVIWIRRTWSDFEPCERRLIGLGAIWFVLCLLPVLGLPAHNNAYYLNIPMVGFAGCLAAIALYCGRRFSQSRAWRVAGWTLLALYIANFGLNTYLGARITPLARMSFDAKNAIEQMSAMHPSFEPGTVLFILDTDEHAKWALDNGNIFEAYYRGQLRNVFLLLKDSPMPLDYLQSRGWGGEGEALYFSYDGKNLIARDENYFVEKYIITNDDPAKPPT